MLVEEGEPRCAGLTRHGLGELSSPGIEKEKRRKEYNQMSYRAIHRCRSTSLFSYTLAARRTRLDLLVQPFSVQQKLLPGSRVAHAFPFPLCTLSSYRGVVEGDEAVPDDL